MFKLLKTVFFETKFHQKLVLEQCLVRNFLHALVVFITLVAQYFGGIGVLDDLVVTLGIGYIILSAISTVLVHFYQQLSRPIAIAGVLTDTFIICFIMYSGADKEAGLYGLLLFLVIANGLRFGKKFMQFANIVSMCGFVAVVIFNEFWQSHVLLSIGNILWLIIIPAHLTNLLNHLEEAIIKAESANTAKTLFLANMSHEIRTPLTSIIGFSKNLLNKQLPENDSQAALDAIIRNGEHLSNIVNDILDISKIETGKLEVEQREFSVFELIHEIDFLFREKIERKGLEFTVNYHYPIPETVVSDSFRIRQVLINLLSNAIKFTQHGRISIDIKFNKKQKKLLISVTDTGIGLSNDKSKEIFSNFTQADTSTTREYGGTGLGLSISKKLVNILGGKLTLESRPGHGSQFAFTIAIDKDFNSALVSQLPDLSDHFHLPADQQLHISGDILLVEDVKDNQLLISNLLQDIGADVDTAENGIIAIEKATQKKYDLILMDIQMPVMGGKEALSHLRKQHYTGPVVFLSANVVQNEEKESKNLDCQGFLSKPINESKLHSVLIKFLRSTRSSNTPSQKRDENKGVIYSSLTANKNSDSKTYEELTRAFALQLKGRINEIDKAFLQQDHSLLKQLLHNLKGLGGNMGYEIITRLISTIEDSINENNTAEVELLIKELYRTEIKIMAGFDPEL